MGTIKEKISKLKTKITKDSKLDENEKKKFVTRVAKGIEEEYKKVKETKGKEEAIKTVVEMITEKITDPELKDILKSVMSELFAELKENTAVPVNDVAPNLVEAASEKEINPIPLYEGVAEVTSDDKLLEIIQEGDIPLEHKNVLVGRITNGDVKKQAIADLKTEEEVKKEKEDLEKLEKIYSKCEDVPDSELEIMIRELNLDLNNDNIKKEVYRVLAKKMVNNSVRFGYTSLYTATNIIPIEEMYADYIENTAQEEYDKMLEVQSGPTDFIFEKNKLRREVMQTLVNEIIDVYRNTGKFVILPTNRMKNLDYAGQTEIIRMIEESLGKRITKMQEKDVRAQMAGTVIDNAKIIEFEDSVITLNKQRRENICDLGIQLAEDERLYNTVLYAEDTKIIKKLAEMPKEYRMKCMDIISQALDKELAQFLKKEDSKNNNISSQSNPMKEEQENSDTGR